ncbi:uroporphyrinogen-III synthase [Agrobacterium larrymoorei]|uniref:Uroporphyrinogen-III synthase n=1 Tax=Agrobacterium larrymoorei TaxID=160699 RepID=A0AAF0KEX0_9HYPH|nr:uroporphyrinogen-III synthase [Agrobacterium larrymoorei]WHA41457.1 uroporphyrinogen-III synthase [Agrobacterium larrymoorei]
MRVVVTRPERSGKKTAAHLRQRGYDPVMLPLTYPVYHREAVRDAFERPPAALAVTSAEALRALQTFELDLADQFPRPLFAVGAATASVAKDMGFQNILTGEGDGRALAKLIEKAKLEGPVVYLAGRPREGGFEETLASMDIELKITEIYEMQPVTWKRDAVEAVLQEPADAVLLYSRETARIFFDLTNAMILDNCLHHSAFVCMSEKVLSAVPERFQEKAIASPVPSEAAMFELLDRLAGT